MSERGLIHIYYGDGKGKTTAALGLAFRAAGTGKNVIFAQFLKGRPCGEHSALKDFSNITLLQGIPSGGKFISQMSEAEKAETKKSCDDCLQKATEAAGNKACDVLVLDEVIDALNLKMLTPQLLENLISQKPDSLEIILTGHNPAEELLAHADYITHMKKQKHPYDKGIMARKGIEF